MILSQTAAETTEKIAVGRMLAEAYITLLWNLRPFALIVLFPLVLGVLLLWGWAEIYPPLFDFLVGILGYQRAVWINSLQPEWFVERIVGWLVLMIFLSHWLQHLTAQKSGGSPRSLWPISRTDVRILRYGLLLTIVPLSSMIVRLAIFAPTNTVETFHQKIGAFEAAFMLLVPASVALECLIAGRSAPIFAAIAAGHPLTLRQAWSATRSQTLRLMVLWFFLYWPAALLAGLLQAAVDDFYVTLVISVYEPGEYLSSYYLAPYAQLVDLPSAVVRCAALALGAALFLRVYIAVTVPSKAVLNRFD